MYASTVTHDIAPEKTQRAQRYSNWQNLLFWGIVVALVVVAIGMRLYHLGVPFDRDGYDEGVYWQTLRS
ncbi:MAG TPA: hypothetical protein VEI53_13715, partial [Ktedonobacteraceae bacterium]|nr:hypothetical protein [Ktedonobacteraceae bacterium]